MPDDLFSADRLGDFVPASDEPGLFDLPADRKAAEEPGLFDVPAMEREQRAAAKAKRSSASPAPEVVTSDVVVRSRPALPRLTVATDGSCLRNPGGPGGWAWVVSDREWGSGGDRSTTNQRMELQAVGEAILAFPDRDLHIQSDSVYAIKCLTDWLPGWIRNNWKNSAKKDVANQDLIRPISESMHGRDITFEHVRGHRGHALNELADQYCGAAALAVQSGSPVPVGPGPRTS